MCLLANIIIPIEHTLSSKAEQLHRFQRILYKQCKYDAERRTLNEITASITHPPLFHSDVWYARVCCYYEHTNCLCFTVLHNSAVNGVMYGAVAQRNICHSLLGREIKHTHFYVALLQLIFKPLHSVEQIRRSTKKAFHFFSRSNIDPNVLK